MRNPPTAARAFGRLRFRLVTNQLRGLVAGSRLRFGMILGCSAVFWTALFLLFFEGFQFLNNYGIQGEVIEYLFGMFFLSLLILLVFSTGIILYTGLFHSREVAYLLTTPSPPDQVFAFKFIEAMAFSSWGFLLLGSPMMVAYGIDRNASAGYYLVFLAFLIGFVLIPGSLGAIGAILVANYLPRKTKAVLATLAGILLVAVGLLFQRIFQTHGEVLTREFFDGLIGQLAFSQHPLLPSTWMAKGLIGAAKGDWSTGWFYLMATTSHAGLAYLLAAVAARDLYRRGYSRVQGGRSSRKRGGLYWLDALFHKAFFFLPGPIRLLILKDLRTFRRDPAQWSQFLIFFGLLAFYFLNIRRLGYGDQASYIQRNLLSFMNLAVTALILSTFTTRFIFPLLSLEGRNLWVLGLLPLRREAILWGKFAFASGISLVATEVLVILSDLMLRVGATMLRGPHDPGRHPLLRAVGDQRGAGSPPPQPPRGRPVEDRLGLRRDAQPPGQPGLHPFGGDHPGAAIAVVFLGGAGQRHPLRADDVAGHREGLSRPVDRPQPNLRGHRHGGAAADGDQGVPEDGVLRARRCW